MQQPSLSKDYSISNVRMTPKVAYDTRADSFSTQPGQYTVSKYDKELMENKVCIEHSSGFVQIDVRVAVTPSTVELESCTVSRTRRLFEGNVLLHI